MKIKLKHTKFQIILEVIAVVVLIGMYAVLLLRWKDIPDLIPGHYNAAGEVNRWGNKSELFILPIASTVLYLLLTVISFFPSIWNMPVIITEENKDRVYHCMNSMLILLKVLMLGIFFYLNYNSMDARSLSPLFLPIVLIATSGPTIYYIRKTIRIAKPVK